MLREDIDSVKWLSICEFEFSTRIMATIGDEEDIKSLQIPKKLLFSTRECYKNFELIRSVHSIDTNKRLSD